MSIRTSVGGMRTRHPGRLAAVVVLACHLAALVPAAAAPSGESGGAGAPSDCTYLMLTDDGSEESEPVRMGSCPGVRPGAAVRTDLGGCTFNFVYRGVVPGRPDLPVRTFIGTAGHCIVASGERAWAPGQGPTARDSSGAVIGRFVYANVSSIRDFALIEVLPGVYVNPEVCHWGGPFSLDRSTGSGPVLLEHSGQGVLFGSTIPGRTHIARTYQDPNVIRFEGLALQGDSGSGMVRSDSKAAVGVLVALAAHADGPVLATRIGPQLDRAGAVLGLSMSLVPAPRLSLDGLPGSG
jgi:hypothetical protein